MPTYLDDMLRREPNPEVVLRIERLLEGYTIPDRNASIRVRLHNFFRWARKDFRKFKKQFLR